MVHSAAGLDVAAGALCLRPPFRSPHHSASAVSLIGGGGARLRPGEILSLIHISRFVSSVRVVTFKDVNVEELPEKDL